MRKHSYRRQSRTKSLHFAFQMNGLVSELEFSRRSHEHNLQDFVLVRETADEVVS
jgi:hypothetical protein